MKNKETLRAFRATVTAGLASTLVALMLVLGGISIFGSNHSSPLQVQAPIAGLGAKVEQTSNQSVVSQAGVVTAPTAATNQAGAGQQISGSVVVDARAVVKKTNPAVVTIINHLAPTTTSGRSGRGGVPQTLVQTASGSGVILDQAGDIVTNYHVVHGQQSIGVIFYNSTQEVPATIVGTDTYSDLAVIKVSAPVPGTASFGDSDALELGQPVVAIGSALGDFTNTVTEGIVSGLHRAIGADQTSGQIESSLQNLIQTDAAINHGNSGGPLFDLNGNIVGINVAVIRSDSMQGDVAEGLGFSIPSNTAQQVTQQLISKGSVNRPYIGISYQTIDQQTATALNLPVSQGIYVGAVEAGSPADKAGIQAQSIITRVDGTTLDAGTSLVQVLAKHKVGDTVTLTVLDLGSSTGHDVKIVLAARPAGQ